MHNSIRYRVTNPNWDDAFDRVIDPCLMIAIGPMLQTLSTTGNRLVQVALHCVVEEELHDASSKSVMQHEPLFW
jgi:hypothetical protein